MELKRFDLLFVKGTSPVSRIIQDVTGSPYSHVAIVLDKWRVAETNWRRPLKPYPLQYPASMYDIGRYKGEITEAHAERMRRYLYERIGSKYDLWQTITNGLFILSGGRIPIVDAADRLNCSEFAG